MGLSFFVCCEACSRRGASLGSDWTQWLFSSAMRPEPRDDTKKAVPLAFSEGVAVFPCRLSSGGIFRAKLPSWFWYLKE